VDAALHRVQETWEALARDDDVLGVIYGYPRLPNQSLESFFAAGEREIGRTLRGARLRRLPRRRAAALDFGCGVGRLTQAIARRFERAVGVDVSPTMIDWANRLNRHGDRCSYVLNEDASLARFDDESFDFVYSNLVLQHMPPELGRAYVGELARVLRPGGLLVFQVPHARAPLPRLPRGAALAEIAPVDAELHTPPGATASLRVRVRNAGSKPWPGATGERMLFLGNHWYDGEGRLLVLDDGRAALGRDVDPADEVELDLTVTAPPEPGDYVLELDLVQESVGWFAERRKLSRRRSQTARIPVRVGEFEPADAVPAADDAQPRMEMHALPRDEVVAILERAGARVVAVRDDRSAGLGWQSLRYTATR
jgi:SAM-dependent methyltransferase